MKLSCLQENLKRGVAMVSHAVAGKSPLPVLSHILLATHEGQLQLAATDLEIGIKTRIGAKIEEEGAVTVPAKLFSDVIGSLPNDRVTLELDARTQTVTVTCARFTSNIKGIEADDFPPIPTIADRDPTISLAPELLRQAIDQVAFAAASDESRPVLTGVLMRMRDDKLVMAAADGFRLATRTLPLPQDTPVTDIREFIVPARALSELARIVGDAEGDVAITVTPGGGQVLFHTDTVDLVSRLIDGNFPDFERIIPAEYTTRTLLDTQELIKATRLASFFALQSQGVAKLVIEPGGELGPGKLTISANAAEVGDNVGELDGMVTGEGGQLAMNVKFLNEALNAMKTAQVALETRTAQSPGVFKPVGQDDYLHVIMPMTIR
jgi:DNA polymerase-3 subunit beta